MLTKKIKVVKIQKVISLWSELQPNSESAPQGQSFLSSHLKDKKVGLGCKCKVR